MATTPNGDLVRSGTVTSTLLPITVSGSVDRRPTFSDKVQEINSHQPPLNNAYPCGCPYPGQHRADCMWSLWEEMKDNYLQTKNLMNKFMTQVESIQSRGPGEARCVCTPECHGRDLAEAVGLQQLQGVTVPWGQQPQPGEQKALTCQLDSERRRLMEDQRRIKNTWAQFLNIFDMALDLANDVSKDRWEANKRHKEQMRLEREQRLEEQRRERRERGSLTTARPPAAAAAQRPAKKQPEEKQLEQKPIKKESEAKHQPKPSSAVEDEEPVEETAAEKALDEAIPEPAQEPAGEEDGREE